MSMVLAVALGGAVGAVTRYGLSSGVTQGIGLGGSGTFVVNVIGALALGVLLGVTEERLGLDVVVRRGLVVGLLGGFTTFSSMMWDIVEHAEQGSWLTASALLIASIGIGLAAMVGGLAIGRGQW